MSPERSDSPVEKELATREREKAMVMSFCSIFAWCSASRKCAGLDRDRLIWILVCRSIYRRFNDVLRARSDRRERTVANVMYAAMQAQGRITSSQLRPHTTYIRYT
jgi:hypothetical protein